MKNNSNNTKVYLAPTGQAIPKGGLLMKFEQYMEKVTGTKSPYNFVVQSMITSLFAGLPSILGCIVRPIGYRVIFGNIGKSINSLAIGNLSFTPNFFWCVEFF